MLGEEMWGVVYVSVSKVFGEGEFRTLLRTLKFFHMNLGKRLHRMYFCTSTVMLKHDLGLFVPVKGNCNAKLHAE